MARFRYEVIDTNGDEQTGVLEAPNPVSGMEQLRGRGFQILTFEYIGRLHFLDVLNPAHYGRVNTRDLIALFRNLALMVRSGNTLLQGLQLATAVTQKSAMRQMLTRIIAEIQGGSSFSAALADQGSRLPPLVSRLVAFAEASGELEITFEELADNLERQVSLRRQFLSAIFYPSVVISVALGVGLFLSVVIIPKFKPFLENRSAELPDTTLMLIGLSDWLVNNGAWLAITVAVLIVMTLAAYTTRAGKEIVDRVLVELPVIGHSIRNAAMAQMGWTMSLLMRAGITVQEALRITSEIIDNHTLSRSFADAQESILSGHSLALSLQQPHIPATVRNMVGLGERAGELEQVMNDLGEYYRKLNEDAFKRTIALLEPSMILFVGGIVAFVYFAFFKALFRLATG